VATARRREKRTSRALFTSSVVIIVCFVSFFFLCCFFGLLALFTFCPKKRKKILRTTTVERENGRRRRSNAKTATTTGRLQRRPAKAAPSIFHCTTRSESKESQSEMQRNCRLLQSPRYWQLTSFPVCPYPSAHTSSKLRLWSQMKL